MLELYAQTHTSVNAVCRDCDPYRGCLQLLPSLQPKGVIGSQRRAQRRYLCSVKIPHTEIEHQPLAASLCINNGGRIITITRFNPRQTSRIARLLTGRARLEQLRVRLILNYFIVHFLRPRVSMTASAQEGSLKRHRSFTAL